MKKYRKPLVILFTIISVILLISAIFSVLTNRISYQVNSVSVSPNQTIESVFQEISFQFNRNIGADFTQKCQIVIEPSVIIDTVIEKNVVTVAPRTNFEFSTNYKTSFFCNDTTIYSLLFTTPSYESLNQTDLERLQTSRDKEFSDEIQRIYQEQPWREKLPIEKPLYTITYSQVRNAYFINLKINKGETVDQQALINDAKQELTAIQAPELEFIFR